MQMDEITVAEGAPMPGAAEGPPTAAFPQGTPARAVESKAS